VLTTGGICLFLYFVYSVGLHEIYDGITKFGFAGLAVILLIHFVRICARAYAWKLCVHETNALGIKDTIPAVIVGEAMSSSIPLGILVSGTSKAIVVRNRIPLVAGLSSVATENLFYSLVTSIFLIAGGITLLRGFAVDESLVLTINLLLLAVSVLVVLGLLMVIRQWHFASAICNWVYEKGFLRGILENGRHYVRRFEDLIYGFYRRYPKRFLPVCLLEAGYLTLGLMETWFILGRLSETVPPLLSAFLLEAVSRFITVIFKLIPFVIGVDEAGAQFVGETIGLAAGVGVTLAVIRKLRILFWTAAGFILIIILTLKRGLTFRDLSQSTPMRNR
jgi:hypothetical protein